MVKKYKKQIREGDLVYIWVSGRNAGIRALTVIETSPLEDKDVGDIIFSTPRQPGEHWVGLAPLEILDEPVWRKDLKADPRLENLEIL